MLSVDKMLTEKLIPHVPVFQLLQSLGIKRFLFWILGNNSLYISSFVEVEKDINFMGLVTKEEPRSGVKAPGQQCFPLFSYIKALDYPTVNLLRWFKFIKATF